ncbi:MAG TPA: hypothetical protein VI383_04620, partial [Gemmatimonadales bacterium]|nr:hypothetical protein [Gemmatimonadales bacterium]
ISGDHVTGVSLCPQALGTFRVTNQSGQPIFLEVGVAGTSSISFTRIDGAEPIPANGSAAFLVVFLCNTNEDVAGQIEVKAKQDDKVVQTWIIAVAVDIRPPPT